MNNVVLQMVPMPPFRIALGAGGVGLPFSLPKKSGGNAHG